MWRILAIACVLCTVLSGCDWFLDASERIDRAERYLARGEDRAAVIELQNALRSEPQNIEARLLLAEVSLRLGDTRSAEQELAAATANGATPEQIAEVAANVHLTKGEHEQLLERIDERALALTEPALSTYRGLALSGLRRFDDAIAAFEAALEVDPAFGRAAIGLAQGLHATGRSDAALERLEATLAADPANPEAWSLKGSILHSQGNTRGAISALQSAKQYAAGRMSGAQINALLGSLVEAHLLVGDLPAAREAHGELVARAGDAPLVKFMAARIAMAEEDYPKAVAEAQAALASAPQLKPAKLLLAAALLANGNPNQAQTHLTELLQQAPDNPEVRKLLAQVNLRFHRAEEATRILEPLRLSGVDDPEVEALLGLAKLQQGEGEAGIELLEQSVAAQPNNLDLKLDLAQAYLRVGRSAQAVELLRSVPEGSGDSRRESLLIAAVAAEQGSDAAGAEIERIVAAHPKESRVLNVAASFFAQRGDYARARSYVERAFELDPADPTTLLNSTRIELAAGDRAAARKLLDDLVAARPAHSAGRFAAAQLAFEMGDEEAGIHWLEEVRKSEPAAIQPRLLLGATYLQRKQDKEAAEVFREIVAAADDKAAARSAIGGVYLQAGRREEAIAQFREAAQSGDEPSVDRLLNLARAQLAAGQRDAARASLSKALALEPDSISANAAIAMLEVGEGRRADAARRLEKLKEAHPRAVAVAVLEGDIAMASKAFSEAADAYAAALKLAASGPVAVRAYRARRLGGLPNSTAPLESWLAKSPDDAAVRLVLAEAYVGEGKRAAAIAQYERVASATRSNPIALNNLAWMYFEAGDSRAEATAKRAYELAPEVPAIADTYGWILVRGGKMDEALPILERAAAAEGSPPDVGYHYAVALKEAGQRHKAREVLAVVLRSGRGFADIDAARRLMQELESEVLGTPKTSG